MLEGQIYYICLVVMGCLTAKIKAKDVSIKNHVKKRVRGYDPPTPHPIRRIADMHVCGLSKSQGKYVLCSYDARHDLPTVVLFELQKCREMPVGVCTMTPQQPQYHPVTREELEQIANNCKYPQRNGCGICDQTNVKIGSGITCTFDNQILVKTILSRPDPLALLEAWRRFRPFDPSVKYRDVVNDWDYENIIIKQLRTNPEAVLEELKEKGVWKE